MKKHRIATAIALCLTLGACSPSPQESATGAASASSSVSTQNNVASKQTESQRLAAFFADVYQAGIDDSPISQSYLGIKDDYDKWDDMSETAVDKNIAKVKAHLTTANAFDENKLSEQERISLAIFKLNAQRQLANDEFRHHTYVVQQFRAAHTFVPSFLINIHRVSSVSDAQAYVSRLEKVEAMFEQVIEQMRLRQANNTFPPQWSYDQMIQATQNVITGQPFDDSESDSTLWADLQRKVATLELPDDEANAILSAGKAALLNSVMPAYNNFIVELSKQRQLSPEGDGVWRLPDGDKWYQNRLAWYTTTDLTADEVHQIGVDNVARIHDAMRNIMQQVEFSGTLAEFFVFMREDEQFYYADSEAGRAQYMADAKAYIDAMEAKIPEYFGLVPQAPMVIKRVEAFREKSAGKAFYQSPARDGSRPGIYYANLYDMKSMPSYQMEALAYHEGIPGHHMQRAITQELDGIPEFQKYVSFTAYTEGWGLYTEELPKEMGFYQDPFSDFGRLAMELWRACRLVVDTGIHAKQWSREEAIAYLIENTPNSQWDATKAIERYIALPGQATAYMIGKLKIMELRENARQALGDKFDIKGFHDEVLKDGPVPLSLLETKIERWVASVKQST